MKTSGTLLNKAVKDVFRHTYTHAHKYAVCVYVSMYTYVYVSMFLCIYTCSHIVHYPAKKVKIKYRICQEAHFFLVLGGEVEAISKAVLIIFHKSYRRWIRILST